MKSQKLINFVAILSITLLLGATAFGQTLYDSFSDGNFTANPVWVGTTGTWMVVADSDAAAGAIGSNTVRLAAPTATAGTEYLSSQISSFGTSQEWGVFFGRRAQAFTTTNQQYFWLYANESNLNSATVDGYRLAIGDNSGDDEIRLEYILNGAVSSMVITSTGAIPNGLTDIGFLVRVTRSATGVFQLYTSTLPTANGTGAIATDIPDQANTPVLQGTGTDNSIVPANNGYIGLAALHTTSAAATSAAEFDQIYFTPTIVTAGEVFVGGRVMDVRGMPIGNATVTLSGGLLTQPRTTVTSGFGYFGFRNVSVANTYLISVSSNRFRFDQPLQVINLDNEETGILFTGTRFFGTASKK